MWRRNVSLLDLVNFLTCSNIPAPLLTFPPCLFYCKLLACRHLNIFKCVVLYPTSSALFSMCLPCFPTEQGLKTSYKTPLTTYYAPAASHLDAIFRAPFYSCFYEITFWIMFIEQDGGDHRVCARWGGDEEEEEFSLHSSTVMLPGDELPKHFWTGSTVTAG